ncbi:hypothetical protein N7E02_08210 [Aliirhizobium terrae]|uniref:hypothetical protein n=1 Tax=Terrirhizobium terrae TaxID=2926709 RepID=UPI0025764068|nr:hypothetical protein [Rhizobium sp. CC-CFT758]WJH40588.1 hypothetical protein N7E02_08210 [Rhizobium sp. CC-CFT758]
MIAAAEGKYGDCADLLCNPTSLLAATLLVFGKMGLANLADGAMRSFDRTNVNFFIPDDYRNFGEGLVEDGMNFSFNIGHSIFSVADVMEQWSAVEEKLDDSPSLDIPAVRIASVLASLLRPDRQAWFLLRDDIGGD